MGLCESVLGQQETRREERSMSPLVSGPLTDKSKQRTWYQQNALRIAVGFLVNFEVGVLFFKHILRCYIKFTRTDNI